MPARNWWVRIAIDGANRIIGVNRSELRLLCAERPLLPGTDFNELMDSQPLTVRWHTDTTCQSTPNTMIRVDHLKPS